MKKIIILLLIPLTVFSQYSAPDSVYNASNHIQDLEFGDSAYLFQLKFNAAIHRLDSTKDSLDVVVTIIDTLPKFNDIDTTLQNAKDYTDTQISTIDGSETKVNAGTNVTVTGIGTTLNPYVINSTGGWSGTFEQINDSIRLYVDRAFTGVLHYDYKQVNYDTLTINSNITITVITDSAKIGNEETGLFIGNGTHSLDFSNLYNLGALSFDNTSGTANEVIFYKGINNRHYYQIIAQYTYSASLPQLQSSSVENSDSSLILLNFDRAMYYTDSIGMQIIVQGTTRDTATILSLTGTGTVQIGLNINDTITGNDTVLFSYDQSGNLIDGNSNELANITNDTVTNNIAGHAVLDLGNWYVYYDTYESTVWLDGSLVDSIEDLSTFNNNAHSIAGEEFTWNTLPNRMTSASGKRMFLNDSVFFQKGDYTLGFMIDRTTGAANDWVYGSSAGGSQVYFNTSNQLIVVLNGLSSVTFDLTGISGLLDKSTFIIVSDVNNYYLYVNGVLEDTQVLAGTGTQYHSRINQGGSSVVVGDFYWLSIRGAKSTSDEVTIINNYIQSIH